MHISDKQPNIIMRNRNMHKHENTHFNTHKQHPEIRSTSLQHVSIYKASSDRTESPAKRAGRGSDSSTVSDDTHTPNICVWVRVCVCVCSHHLIWFKELVPHSKEGWDKRERGVSIAHKYTDAHTQCTHLQTNLDRAGAVERVAERQDASDGFSFVYCFPSTKHDQVGTLDV